MTSLTTFVSYVRVSTERQGRSGLGLEVQRDVVNRFVSQNQGQLIAEYVEVVSGKRQRRKELSEALEKCRKHNATLVIAKLDRLARNVHFISGLIESGVNFRVADMPEANRFVLHVMAAVAEQEGRAISERTKAALSRARARGVRLGVTCRVLADKKIADAEAFSREMGPLIAQLKDNGLSVRKIAERLNIDKVPSYGGGDWHSTTVQRVWTRFRLLEGTYIGNFSNPPCQNP